MIACPVLMAREIRAEALDEDPPQPRGGGGVLPMAVFWATAGYAAQAMREYAIARAYKGFERESPLPDVVHDAASPTASPMFLVVGAIVPALVIVVGRVFSRSSRDGVRLLRRVLFLHALFMILHACCRLATSLPPLYAEQRTTLPSFFAPVPVAQGQTELVILAVGILVWSDLSRATRAATLGFGLFVLVTKVASQEVYTVDVVSELCYSVPILLHHKSSLKSWLRAGRSDSRASIQREPKTPLAGAGSGRAWLVLLGDDEVVRIRPGERRVIGRAELPGARVSRSQLLVSHDPHTPESVRVKCMGRIGLIVHDEKYGASWDVAPDTSFAWFADQTVEVAAAEGEAYFLSLASAK